MLAEYSNESEEFFAIERKQVTSNKKYIAPLQIRKTVCILGQSEFPLINNRGPSRGNVGC